MEEKAYRTSIEAMSPCGSTHSGVGYATALAAGSGGSSAVKRTGNETDRLYETTTHCDTHMTFTNRYSPTTRFLFEEYDGGLFRSDFVGPGAKLRPAALIVFSPA
jgi:hypothetical protein